MITINFIRIKCLKKTKLIVQSSPHEEIEVQSSPHEEIWTQWSMKTCIWLTMTREGCLHTWHPFPLAVSHMDHHRLSAFLNNWNSLLIDLMPFLRCRQKVRTLAANIVDYDILAKRELFNSWANRSSCQSCSSFWYDIMASRQQVISVTNSVFLPEGPWAAWWAQPWWWAWGRRGRQP